MDAGVTALITRYLCENGGCLGYQELYEAVRERFGVTEKDLSDVLTDTSTFVLTKANVGNTSSQDRIVTAKNRVRVCPSRGDSCAGCAKLHLCTYFVCGNCKYRDRCRDCHELDTYHNTEILIQEHLISLNEAELSQLLLQNDPYLLPEICSHYNKGNKPHGYCKFKEKCNRLHICVHFLQEECRFGNSCRLSHAFDSMAKKILKGRGLDLIDERVLQQTYKNRFVIAESAKTAVDLPCLTETGKEICLFFLSAECRFKENCKYTHHPLPYQWKILDCDNAIWKDLPNMEQVEMDYCSPDNDFSQGPLSVNFLTMTCGSSEVCRLSTPSSVSKPMYVLTTRWLWYWKDSHGQWNLFSCEGAEAQSQRLEKKYLADKSSEVNVSVGSLRCVLSFKDMCLRNGENEAQVQMEVRRRPQFLAVKDVQKILTSRSSAKVQD